MLGRSLQILGMSLLPLGESLEALEESLLLPELSSGIFNVLFTRVVNLLAGYKNSKLTFYPLGSPFCSLKSKSFVLFLPCANVAKRTCLAFLLFPRLVLAMSTIISKSSAEM